MSNLVLGFVTFITSLASAFHAQMPMKADPEPSIKLAETSVKHDEKENIDYRDDVSVQIDPILFNEPKIFKAVYSEEIFFHSASTYSHFLARQSCGLALAAFNLQSEDKKARNTSIEEGTLTDYFKSTGYSTIRYDDYDKETSLYTIGSAIATKDISYQGEQARLLVVAIRGGNYKNEWQSNFTLGNGMRHEGFDKAAALVTDRVLSFYASYPSNLPTKIWITGFSRAGAVANLVAANLNSIRIIPRQNIFAYTFAAPAAIHGTGLDLKSDYDNIHNLVGASDVIPQFVPQQWGFMRYGIDKVIVGSEFDPTFDHKYERVQKRFEALGGKTYYVPELNFRMRMLYGLLLELSDTQEQFVELLQPVFVGIMQDSSVNSVFEMLRNTLIKYEEFSSSTAMEKDVVIDYVLSLAQPVLTKSSFMKGKASSGNPAALFVHEHLPDVYIHNLYAFDEEESFVRVPEFDYIVLDSRHYSLIEKGSGQELLHIDQGIKTLSAYAEQSHLDYTLFSCNGKHVLILPHDRDYELRYRLEQGEDLRASIVPCNQYFVSNLTKHDFSVTSAGAREGIVMSVQNEKAIYPGSGVPYSPNLFTRELGIDSLFMSYHVYVLLLAAVIALILIALLWLLAFIHARLVKRKLRVGRLLLTSTIIFASVEAELMFWFTSNLILYNLLFKALSGLCFLALYLLGKRLRDFKRIDKTILPSLLAFILAYIIASVHIVAALSLNIAGAIYLIVYHLRKARPKPHLWLIYALALLFGVPLLLIFMGPLQLESILYLCFVPFMVLVGFTAIPLGSSKEAPSFLWIAAMGSLGVYLFSTGGSFIGSVLYVILLNISLVLFVSTYDKKDASLLQQIEAPKNQPEPITRKESIRE